MLDIQKELEKFNRLLDEVDDDAVGAADNGTPADADADVDQSQETTAHGVAADEATDAEAIESIDVGQLEDAQSVVELSAAEAVPVSREILPSTDDAGTGDGYIIVEDAVDEGPLEVVELEANDVSLDADSAGDAFEAYDATEEVDYSSEEFESTAEEKAWTVTEHVPEGIEDVVEPMQDVTDAAMVTPISASLSERENADVPSNGLPVRPDPLRFPNPRGFSFEDASDKEDVDSLLQGARGALTDSHHLRPSRLTPPLTVTLPEPVEVDEEDDLESMAARILPLLTFRSGVFEERLGAVVGAVAGLVILAAGVLFVPRLFSAEETGPIADAALESAQDHLHASAEPIAEVQTAALSIATFPPGARVYLNAELIGVTPFKDVAVERGDYQVSIEKADFAAIDTFLTLESGSELFFDLSEEAGLVTQVAAEGADHQLLQVAEVEDNDLPDPIGSGESSNTTTDNEPEVTPEPRRRQSRSSSSSARTPRVQPPATGGLVVTSEPMGAVVFLGDDVVGETPATLTDVVSGPVRLALQKDGFVPYETEINVMASIQTPFHAALAPVKASLFVNASPGGDLYVDDQLISRGIAPGHMELIPVGSRTIKIVHPDYGEYTEVVNVTTDNKASVSVDMASHGYGWSIENGDRLFAESRYQEAMQNYRRASTLRPGNAALENKIALAAKAMAESSMPSTDSRTAPIDGIYSVTDTSPQLIGGLAALHSNVVYPEEAYNEGIQGRVYVQFVVDEEGKPQDITIAKGLQGGCNEAAIRAVKKARFKPATVAGVPVKARHTLFVNFTI